MRNNCLHNNIGTMLPSSGLADFDVWGPSSLCAQYPLFGSKIKLYKGCQFDYFCERN